MPLNMLSLLIGSLALAGAAPSSNVLTGDIIYNTGTQHDGRWSCPWMPTSGLSCPDGKFKCICPGDGEEVHYAVGCCFEFPTCGTICNLLSNCDRYVMCKTCRSGGREHSANVCHSCHPGFALGVGDCKTDIDECIGANGGCAQVCRNTYGSYHCGCHAGYRLKDNRVDCERLSCKHPGEIDNISVEATDDWLYDSYAKYSCKQRSLTVVGSSLRKCEAVGHRVFWTNEEPKCQDSCDAVKEEGRVQCGGPSTRETKCQQLGCCYDETSSPRCFHNTVLAFVKYAGEIPDTDSSSHLSETAHSSVDGCAFQCASHHSGSCGSFGMHHIGNNKQGVSSQNCHLNSLTRKEYADRDEIVYGDASYDLYEPIHVTPPPATYGSKHSVIEKLYMGCYAEEKGSNPDMEFLAYTSNTDMTVERCIEACHNHHYLFAGLQGGSHCYCSSSVSRNFGVASDCGTRCSGDSGQLCGSGTSNSIYHVPADVRYQGCYTDLSSDLDLTEKMWDAAGKRSATDCIEECAREGYLYAGVQNGGSCYCGNQYGRHGGAHETACNVSCHAWASQNCGGRHENAIYDTQIAFDLSDGSVDYNAVKAYDSSGRVTGVSTRMFSLAPGLRSIITNKLVIHSSLPVQAPIEDEDCANNCYSPCGDIYREENIYAGDEVTLRFFYFRISDLSKYTTDLTTVVRLYTQTLVIDDDVTVAHALLIRTRQMIIDRSVAVSISVHNSAPDLGITVDDIKYNGPEPDVLFEKQSYMCARILLEGKRAQYSGIAWSIVNDLSSSAGRESSATQTFSAAVRTYQAELAGLDRADLHYVPYYSKSHIAQILGNFYDRISIYREEYSKLQDRSLTQKDFLDITYALQKIYADTDVAEFRNLHETKKTAVATSNSTYYRMKAHYDEARVDLDVAKVAFEKGLQEKKRFAIAKATLKFVEVVAKIVVGVAAAEAENIQEDMKVIFKDVQEAISCLQDVADAVHQTEMLEKMANDIFDKVDLGENVHDTIMYMDSIELMVSMKTNLVQWENMKTYGDVMLTEDNISNVPGSSEYKRAFLDVTNWGLAMTRSMLEKAEMMRQSIDAKLQLQVKLEQQSQLNTLFEGTQQGMNNNEAIMNSIIEQSYDVRMDLNEALIMFCQAYFYENLYECKDSYKPSFGGDFTELLFKINSARRDALLITSAPSTAKRIISITDSDMDGACSDVALCPINYFRKNRVLYYTLPVDLKALEDLEKYKVSEIVLDVIGAKPAGEHSELKMIITSSGDFQSRSDDVTYNFLTKPLQLSFEYDVITGHISLHADVYQPFRNIVHHITPYTTWIIRISERSDDIDLSEVTSIRMRLDGSAVDTGMYYSVNKLTDSV